MTNKFITLFLFLVSTNTFAFNFPIEISEYLDNGKIDAYIHKSDINEKAKWAPFETQVPLTVNAAIEQVKQHLETNKQLNGTTLVAIELKQIPHHKNYWHYLVKVQSKIDNVRQNHFYVVLMDGKVISAFQEPDAIK